MTPKARLLEMVWPRKREFADRLVIVLMNQGEPEERAVQRAAETLLRLKYIDEEMVPGT